jgi:glycosyltransferase involved in cell wall biosynthesis
MGRPVGSRLYALDMKNVVLVNHYAVPPTDPGGTRHYSLARRLVAHGWRMTIVADSVHHKTRVDRLGSRERSRVDVIEDVEFLWLRGDARGKLFGRYFRGIGMLCFAWQVATMSLSGLPGGPRPDVVIGSSVHPFAAFAAWVLAKRSGAEYVFEVRDLWPETLILLGKFSRSSPLVWLLYGLERFLFKRARLIVSPLPYISEYVGKYPACRSKVRVIHNGIDFDEADASRESAALLHRPKWSKTVLYTGAMGTANDLHSLLAGFTLFQRSNPSSDVGLMLVGDGPLRGELAAAAASLGSRNVEFVSSVPKHAVASLVSSADVLVITVPHQPELYKYGVCMNKFWDYLASGRPTLSANSATGDPVASSGAGLNVPAGDPLALADGLGRLLSLSEEEQRRLGRLGREYVRRNHDFKSIASVLADALDEVASQRSS